MLKKICLYLLTISVLFLDLNIISVKLCQADYMDSFYSGIEEYYNLTEELCVDFEEAYITHIELPDIDTPFYTGDIKIVNDKLYITTTNRDYFLLTIDISDPNKMEITNSFGDFLLDSPIVFSTPPGSLWSYPFSITYFVSENRFLYINASPNASQLRVITIDLLNPSIIADSFLTTENGDAFFYSYWYVDSKSKRAFFQSANKICCINIFDPNDIKVEAVLDLYNLLNISSQKLYSIINENIIFTFLDEKLYVIDISDVNNPKIIGNLSFDYYFRDNTRVLLHNNILYATCRGSEFFVWFESCPYTHVLPRHLISFDVSDPNRPSFLGEVKVSFTSFDKNNLRNLSTLCTPELNSGVHELYNYNDYIFVVSSRRVYIIDAKVPATPKLIGYIDFPYSISDMAFHNDYFYISTRISNVSRIYKYDPSKIIPARTPVDQTQEGEDQTSQEVGDQSSQGGENTSEGGAAPEGTTAGTGENNGDQSSPEGGDMTETGTGTEGSAPQTGEGDGNGNAQGKPASVNNSIQYWAAFYPWWQINSMQINLLMDNYPSLFPTPRNPLIEKPPYIFYPSLPFDLFPKPICLDPSTDSWYLPLLPYSHLNLILDYDRMNYNLFSFYPIAEIPDLLYFLYGIKIEREP